ncbi:[protein-PII] uridylyltransferase [Gilvimarinus agarilyticus]|uniref:[protein-PII] uridylyltransferase n=1 Tax=Gilvimarinus sp. 2_MG-2023 TaxID=3062666 RepID=UPI001C09130A|nr:[protein-PII] uridylyltransferase [Gilvimarinus sp. 2_MG-2023]MBU2886969.1 [protein-PII] uridylyltransferase [Gilvimarinus agarilyticus]MDO6571629.1 [protein-PII] uridylyltransferase [Gilvimarinus sp. 2_MG-2023]
MAADSLPYFTRPLFFFDQTRFRQALVSQPVIGVFKDAITAANAQFDVRFKEGEDIRALIHERALFIDCILHYVWHQFDWPEGISLEAVGGYGRCELHPHSDIDLLILLNESIEAECKDNLEQLLTLLWDIGLEIGHSVRTIEQCLQIAAEDITVGTNLMESRTLVGDSKMRATLEKLSQERNLWPADEFFKAKFDEQNARHQKYKNSEYNLEPNIKNAPGGLRDIQMIGWVAKRYFAVKTLKQLDGKGFFTEEEFSLLQNGEEFLWRVRYGLHMVAGRPEERLLFDHQRQLAQLFGYKDNDENLAVEQFMHHYYRLVMSLRELNDVLLQFLYEAILQKGVKKTVTPINERFQRRDDYIEVSHIYVFEESPSALLEIFVLMAQNPSIRGVRASTIRLMRENRYLIDENYRLKPENQQLFLQLFSYPEDLVEILKRMSRYGVLGLYLPEFGRVTGQMQHDLFHIYTVDAHTLLLVQNLCNFLQPQAKEDYPVAWHVMRRLPKVETVLMAGLYHDIGKGRGGDHSELGAVDAREFGERHNLSPRETRLISWLVEKHLLMSAVSQKQDISDPDVIHNFALIVGDQLHLDYLYALTVADVNATNPDLWNTWRASLMRTLYLETKRALRRGLENPIDKQDWIEETQEGAISRLSRHDISAEQCRSVWEDVDDDYFLRESMLDIAWHTEAILMQENPAKPLILIQETSSRELEGATQIFVRCKGRDKVFATMAAALDQLNLSVQDARIYSSKSGFTLDTFFVLNQDGEPLGTDPAVLQRLHKHLTTELEQMDEAPSTCSRRTPRRLKHFTMPTRTIIRNDIASGYTLLEVISPDRPGLLACISGVFIQFDLHLQNAKIATLGERVEDIFYITDNQEQPLADPELCQRLQEEICRQLDDRVDQAAGY